MNFITQNDITNIPKLVAEALELKASPLAYNHLGKGKTLGLLFFNNSLRTRISTQKAAQNLGLENIVLSATERNKRNHRCALIPVKVFYSAVIQVNP